MNGANGSLSEGGDSTVGNPLPLEALRFHWLPAEYMHSSWWRPGWLPEELFERLRRNRRSLPHLSRFLARELRLAGDLPSAWEAAHLSLAVTSAGRLGRLAALAGITLASPAIAGVLRSRDRSRIVSEIGERDYRFAVKRGRFLLQRARLAQAAEGFGTTLPETMGEESRRLGIASLATALQNAQEPLIRRIQLKLPKGLVESHWQPLMPTSEGFLRLFQLLDAQEPPA